MAKQAYDIGNNGPDKTEKCTKEKDANETPGGPIVAADFETAITLAGSGTFLYSMILTSGLIFLACGLQNGINAYILPAAKCDFDMTSGQMGILNAAFLAGGIASSYVWGVLADALGRRPIVVYALLADAICSVLSTFSPNYTVFVIFRFLSGSIIGGPAALLYLYVGEFLSSPDRPRCNLIIGSFWTISWLVLPGLAWLVLPQPWEMSVLGITFNSWRAFLAMLAVPSLLGAVLAARLPETPKYLVSQGRLKEALEVFRMIYVTNTGRSAESYPVTVLAAPASGGSSPGDMEAVGGAKDFKSVLRVARRTWHDAVSLFRPPVLARTALVCTITFGNMFSYYGLAMWLPELFNRFEIHYHLHPNKTITVCELSRNWAVELQEMFDERTRGNAADIDELLEEVGEVGCKSGEAVNETVFMETLTISSVCLLASILAACIASRVGRRTLPAVLNVLAGAACVGIYFVDSTAGNLAVASLVQALLGTGNTALNNFLVDVFPPRASALGMCSAILAGRLGAVVSNLVLGALLDVSCEVPIFLMAGTVAVGGMLCVLVQPRWQFSEVDAGPTAVAVPSEKDDKVKTTAVSWIKPADTSEPISVVTEP